MFLLNGSRCFLEAGLNLDNLEMNLVASYLEVTARVNLAGGLPGLGGMYFVYFASTLRGWALLLLLTIAISTLIT